MPNAESKFNRDRPKLSQGQGKKRLVNKSTVGQQFWFCLSLAFAASYSLLAMREGFSSEYVVQEDARQHVVWMLGFLDPELFPNDLIADYFQSVAPIGYASLYRLAATISINPLLFNKFLPPILGLITSGYCFAFCLQILPVPAAGFFATLVLNQNLWMKDDLASATPRAFAYPLLLAFLYYLSRRSLWCCVVAIALMGLFYPHCVFLGAGLLVLQLFRWQDGQFLLETKNLRFCAIALFVAFGVMLPYALVSSEFGPVITAAQAKQLPEFLSGGRSAFFEEEFITFWFFGGRSGMFPELLLTPLTLVAGFFLPLVLNSVRFPLARNIRPAIWLLPQLLLVSISLFFIAHAFLFKLHLPNRYTSYSFRILLAVAAGITLTILLDVLRGKKVRLNAWMQKATFLLAILIVSAIIFYPSFLGEFPKTKYQTGHFPGLYEFLRSQPKQTAIASLAEEANNIPAFAQRTVLVAPEYAIPYHLGYYLPFRERVLDLIQAQYSLDIAQVKNFIHKYKVDYWLLDKSAFTPEYLENPWLRQYQPATAAAIENLEAGIPALASFVDQCSVFAQEDLIVLSARCIVFQ